MLLTINVVSDFHSCMFSHFQLAAVCFTIRNLQYWVLDFLLVWLHDIYTATLIMWLMVPSVLRAYTDEWVNSCDEI